MDSTKERTGGEERKRSDKNYGRKFSRSDKYTDTEPVTSQEPKIQNKGKDHAKAYSKFLKTSDKESIF